MLAGGPAFAKGTAGLGRPVQLMQVHLQGTARPFDHHMDSLLQHVTMFCVGMMGCEIGTSVLLPRQLLQAWHAGCWLGVQSASDWDQTCSAHEMHLQSML